MFENFEKTKEQLTELAEIINRFKSEAVQLKLLEILLGKAHAQASKEERADERPTRRRRRRGKASQDEAVEKVEGKKRRSGASGTGAVATLLKTYEEGFFSQPRTIGDICAHCETHHARRVKPNEISGKLGRMVRERQLSELRTPKASTFTPRYSVCHWRTL